MSDEGCAEGSAASFEAIVIENYMDLHNSHFRIFPHVSHYNRCKFARTEAFLPEPLRRRRGLMGTDIFYFEFRDKLATKQGFELELFTLPKIAPAFLYLKYYVHIDSKKVEREGVPEAFYFPTKGPNPLYDEHVYTHNLEITHDFKWKTVMVELDMKRVTRNEKIHFGALNLALGDLFLVDEFILFIGEGAPRLEKVPDWLTAFRHAKPGQTSVDLTNCEPEQNSVWSSVAFCLSIPVRLVISCFATFLNSCPDSFPYPKRRREYQDIQNETV